MRSAVRTLARALVPDQDDLTRDQRDAVNALALHIIIRLEQTEFEPFDEDGKTFLTDGWMQRRLRDVGARCGGEKAAVNAIRWLCAHGLLESTVIVYAVVDDTLSPDYQLGDAVEVFIRRDDAERFIEEVRDDDPDLASYLRIEERDLDAGRPDQHRFVVHLRIRPSCWPLRLRLCPSGTLRQEGGELWRSCFGWPCSGSASGSQWPRTRLATSS